MYSILNLKRVLDKKEFGKSSGAGFTLIEIMIVVGIVVVLVLLAIPNILRSRMVANEGAALANLKTLFNALQMYHVDRRHYPDSLTYLIAPDSNPPYIDSELASGLKQNYDFVYTPNGGGFVLCANPTGIFQIFNARYFYVDETGIIRAKSGSPAGPSDEIVK